VTFKRDAMRSALIALSCTVMLFACGRTSQLTPSDEVFHATVDCVVRVMTERGYAKTRHSNFPDGRAMYFTDASERVVMLGVYGRQEGHIYIATSGVTVVDRSDPPWAQAVRSVREQCTPPNGGSQ
jgi:hypothetical protein